MKQRGFTSIEILVSIGIIALVASVIVISLFGRKNTSEVNLTAQRMTALLREAQSRAISQASSSDWGVHFEYSTGTLGAFYVLFAGTSAYPSSSWVSGPFPLPAGIRYDNLSAGSSTDIIFRQLSGLPTTTSTISIVRSVSTSTGATVTIGTAGSIYYATSTGGGGGGGGGGNPAPTVSGASPSAKPQGAANQDIVITGTGFLSGAAATFSNGGITVNSTTYNSATQVTASITISAGASTGSGNITVTNTDSQFGSCTSCFTVNAKPDPTSVSPNSVAQGATQTLTINGTGFASGLSVSFSGSGITINSTTFVNSTQATTSITVAGGAATGARDVTITNTDAGTGTLSGGLTITGPAPTVSSASPSSRGQGATNQSVAVIGTNFVSGATVTTTGTGITINNTTFASSTQININIDVAAGATASARNVTVTNPDAQSATCTSCFTVNAGPTVSSVSSSSLPQGVANKILTITGTNFTSGLTVTTTGTGITINGSTFVSATQATTSWTIASDAATSTRNITVTNADAGTGTGASLFTVNATPTVTSASPNSAPQSTTTIITVNGTGFDSGVIASFSGTGITVNGTTFVSETQATTSITISAGATTGARDITMTNPDTGAGTGTGVFTVTASQQNTGYLLGSGSVTTSSAPWLAPTPDWFTDEAPPTAAQDARATTTSSASPTAFLKGFNFGISAGSSIDKICVLVNNVSITASGSGTQKFNVSLTWDGGTSSTTENTAASDITDTTLTGIEQYYKDTSSAPGTSDPSTTCTTWGRTWAVSEMSSSNFGVKIRASNTSATARQIRFDVIKVNVYYTPP